MNLKLTANSAGYSILKIDVPKKDFKKVANKIEKLFKDKFKSDDWFEVDCVRYDDSEYSEYGYDVELLLRIHYKLISDDDI